MSFAFNFGRSRSHNSSTKDVTFRGHRVHLLQLQNQWRQNGNVRKTVGWLFKSRLCLHLHVQCHTSTRLGRLGKLTRPIKVFLFLFLVTVLINPSFLTQTNELFLIWFKFDDVYVHSTVYYGQYRCSGAGAATSKRVEWARNLTGEEAAPFLTKDSIDGKAWIRSAPTSFKKKAFSTKT